jgi:hypothetical protein
MAEYVKSVVRLLINDPMILKFFRFLRKIGLKPQSIISFLQKVPVKSNSEEIQGYKEKSCDKNDQFYCSV